MVRTVFVNGTFDILHLGHLSLLNFARAQGDKLVVAIDDDVRVREKKGYWRPVNNVYERKEMLLNLKPVDEVRVFSSDQELRGLVQYYNPWVMVVGDDYRGKEVIGSEFANSLMFFEKINGYSTTGKIKHIIGG